MNAWSPRAEFQQWGQWNRQLGGKGELPCNQGKRVITLLGCVCVKKLAREREREREIVCLYLCVSYCTDGVCKRRREKISCSIR